MQNLLEHLKTVLEKDENLTVDGKLNKPKIEDLALKLDSSLLKLLIKDEQIKKYFFEEVEGVLVFDKVKFQQFLNNKSFLPDSYTAYKNKIGLTTEREYLSESKEVVLAWPHKDSVLQGGQDKEDAKRDEIFWNETLAPDDIDRLLSLKTLTNFERFSSDDSKEVNVKKYENYIVKGNNLLALHSIKHVFENSVDLIYIDPPYNTNRDSFQYNDSFSMSTWLTFIKNRLDVAEKLLSKSGVIFVQISDVGVSKLRLLMDEVFGEENFVNKISVKTRSPSGFKTVNLGVFETAEYLLVYAKDKKQWKYNVQYVETEHDENYRYVITNIKDSPSNWEVQNIEELVALEAGYKSYKEMVDEYPKILIRQLISDFALKNAEQVFRFTTINNDAGKETLEAKKQSQEQRDKVFIVNRDNYDDRFVLNGQEISFYSKKVKLINGEAKPTILLTNIWTDIAWEGIAREGGVKLKQGKKPEKLLQRIIDMATNEGDLVLDFFLGSGTTTAVAHKMGRKYIGIEQLDYADNDVLSRLKNVIEGDSTGISKPVEWKGGGSFVYFELLTANQKWIDNIQVAKNEKELLKLWEAIQEKAFISYKVDIHTINASIEDFQSLSLVDQKRFLIEVLDKNLLYVNYSEMEDEDFAVNEQDKAFTKQFYSLANDDQ